MSVYIEDIKKDFNKVVLGQIGLNNEIIVKYEFKDVDYLKEYVKDNLFFIDVWYVDDNVLYAYGRWHNASEEIKKYKIWENAESLKKYNDICLKVHNNEIERLKNECVEY